MLTSPMSSRTQALLWRQSLTGAADTSLCPATETMKTMTLALPYKSRERFPNTHSRIISDNGSQFVVGKEFQSSSDCMVLPTWKHRHTRKVTEKLKDGTNLWRENASDGKALLTWNKRRRWWTLCGLQSRRLHNNWIHCAFRYAERATGVMPPGTRKLRLGRESAGTSLQSSKVI